MCGNFGGNRSTAYEATLTSLPTSTTLADLAYAAIPGRTIVGSAGMAGVVE
jgi:hypothetical protein